MARIVRMTSAETWVAKCNIMIRKVNSDTDVSAIAEIYNHYISATTVSFEIDCLDIEEMRARIVEISERYPYYVYVDNDEVIGYCYAHPWKERPAYSLTLETTIYLAANARHRGVGKQLMDKLIEECRLRGYHALVACITAENEESCAFHRTLGFEKVSCFREVGCKFGRFLDVVDYQLIL